MIHIKTFSKRLLLFGLGILFVSTDISLNSMVFPEELEYKRPEEVSKTKKESEYKTFLQRTITAIKRNPGKTTLALIGVSASIGVGILWLNGTLGRYKGLYRRQQKHGEMFENLPKFKAPSEKEKNLFNKHVKLDFKSLYALESENLLDYRSSDLFKPDIYNSDYLKGNIYYPDQSGTESGTVLIYDISEGRKRPILFTSDQWNEIVNPPK